MENYTKQNEIMLPFKKKFNKFIRKKDSFDSFEFYSKTVWYIFNSFWKIIGDCSFALFWGSLLWWNRQPFDNRSVPIRKPPTKKKKQTKSFFYSSFCSIGHTLNTFPNQNYTSMKKITNIPNGCDFFFLFQPFSRNLDNFLLFFPN